MVKHVQYPSGSLLSNVGTRMSGNEGSLGGEGGGRRGYHV